MARTVITGSYPFDELNIERQIFEEAGVDLVTTDADSAEDLIAAVDDADGLIYTVRPTTREVFEHFESLEVVGTAGVGVDYIDLDAASDHGVFVSNAPGVNAEEVSTHTIAILLSTVRQIPLYDKKVREGEWGFSLGRSIHRISNTTLGIVGFGNIGQRVAAKATGFDIDVLASDPYLSATEIANLGARERTFEEILAESDFVTNHTPLTERTRHMYDAAAFDAMKEDAIFVNASRGGVVDEVALNEALVKGQIKGAALDVFEEEPPGNSPLFELDNVVLTPHVGGYSEEAIVDGRSRMAQNVVRVLQGKQPENIVNDTDWL